MVTVSFGLPMATLKGLKMPDYPADTTGVTLNANAPTDGSYQAAADQAHGKIPVSGAVMVEVADACTVNLYIYSVVSQKWRLAGAGTGSYQKVFAAGGIDYFEGPVNALFKLVVSADTHNAWHSGDPV